MMDERVMTMGAISRRDFIRGVAGAGVCALGGGALLGQMARAEETTDLPWHAREALYYTSIQDGLDCATCHGQAEPSRVTYCHVPHSGQYVRCQLCPRECIISEGHRGEC